MTPRAPMPPGPPGGMADREWTENGQAIGQSDRVGERLST